MMGLYSACKVCGIDTQDDDLLCGICRARGEACASCGGDGVAASRSGFCEACNGTGLAQPAADCDAHTPSDGSWWEHDGYGIPLCRVCPTCKARKLARYRRDIMTAYDCDEPIEPEEY